MRLRQTAENNVKIYSYLEGFDLKMWNGFIWLRMGSRYKAL